MMILAKCCFLPAKHNAGLLSRMTDIEDSLLCPLKSCLRIRIGGTSSKDWHSLQYAAYFSLSCRNSKYRIGLQGGDIMEQLQSGDRIANATLLSGKDRLFIPSANDA